MEKNKDKKCMATFRLTCRHLEILRALDPLGEDNATSGLKRLINEYERDKLEELKEKLAD